MLLTDQWAELVQQPLSAHQRLEYFIQQILHAHVDDWGFLQVDTQVLPLDASLSPLNPFFVSFRDQVRQAYPTAAGLTSDYLGHQIHLLRSYLDLLYLNYLRHYQSGDSDYQRLLNFAHTHRVRLDYTTGARYHNRLGSEWQWPRYMKVQLRRNSWARQLNPARMIEVIIDIESGQLVSEWQVYRQLSSGRIDSEPSHYSPQQLQRIANTESFNYGIPHGDYYVYPRDRSSHRWLDVQQPTNSELRKAAKRLWPAPQPHKYQDLIRLGYRDIKAWRAISPEQRGAVYHDFINHIRTGYPNWGINYFVGSQARYSHYYIY